MYIIKNQESRLDGLVSYQGLKYAWIFKYIHKYIYVFLNLLVFLKVCIHTYMFIHM
jgi:hypothetical protein